MKGPTRREDTAVTKLYEAKIAKTKRIVTTSSLAVKTQAVPTTYDEAKASCKARKRKERQESVSSLCQERKVIRSNSEERPAQKMYIDHKTNIRRVSSSEDFQRSNSSERNSVSPHRSQCNDKTLVYEDYEHEKRRSHERFARPLTLKSKKHPNKRLRIRYVSKTKYKPEIVATETSQHYKKTQTISQDSQSNENDAKDQDKIDNYLELLKEEHERSSSPTQAAISPVLDLKTLHEQVDSSEPMLSQSRQVNENTETLPSLSIASNRLLSSPRNSIIATHRIYLDPDIPKMISSIDQKLQNPVDEKMQKISKQINSLKKKIKRYEADFEARNGYRPSHIEKINDKNIKKQYSELTKLKKEQKQLAEMSTSCSLIQEQVQLEKTTTSLEITVEEIEKRLIAKREAAGRCYNTDDMTSEQLVDEKVAIQKALLYLESIHGRPNNREDRDLVRPFYDRYRTLKRMLSKLSTTSSTGNELATIHENETMNFITPNSSSQSNDTESEKTTILPSISTDSSDTDTSIGDNLHSLPRSELIQQLKVVTEEKKELRRKIKDFELDVQVKTGRMIQKEDKAPIETIYVAYKKTKAKFRLLEALVGKSK